MNMGSRNMSDWIDKGFMALISAVSIYVGSQINDLSKSVNDLNTKLSVYIAKSDALSEKLNDHENRLRAIERGKGE